MSLISKTPIYFGPFLVTPQESSPHHPRPPETHTPQLLTNINNQQVFYVTPLSFALVNLKPLLPGHVLVCPLRRVPRVTDLTPSETTDLFLTVRRVGRMIQRVYHGTSLNIAIQDGPEAGQTVPHVHAHIIPRRKADLEHRGGSDAIYEMMEGREGNIARHLGEMVEEKRERERERERSRFPGVDNETREPRSEEEMMEEAFALAKEMEGEAVD
ncbi:bis(5'-nucleosidyl)-tetraphosphatase [Blastomyces gilchristii SLH14081]|uniref:Bis(5'-adenosyl)-triphosphatase n=1 Tax=Blastomyces gilchristii (strain SLH14081) TaxID=559298 RepID=A0A179U7P1_BLAGS|nr:bis(5'-nucleosidyl)-tetraphosphatase [Blastomyces gilchristii SLH14081]OAT04045.1 bis(5'-nucleosidyl)-tetraphosphatase [Blastomyces gilchristii SLH14081]